MSRLRTNHPSNAALSSSRALLLVDQRPLQRAAWAEFHAARKRHEKAGRDLQRHEETDTPAFKSWLAQTFPQLITALRELHQDLAQKAAAVETVQFQAAMTGRSLKKLWAEYKAYQADPEAYERAARAEEEAEAKARAEAEARNPRRSGSHPADEMDDAFDDFFKGFFDEDDAEDSYRKGPRSHDTNGDFHSHRPSPKPENADAKEIYRRLVSVLHPDRGGAWTPARERLWHEVQEAWAARDADWLARLEVSWETANDTVGPDSSLGRLRLAIAELDAARRDTERKLRHYRKTQPWRFTLSEKKRPKLSRQVENELLDDLQFLRRQLDHLNRTIAAWESPLPGRRRRG